VAICEQRGRARQDQGSHGGARCCASSRPGHRPTDEALLDERRGQFTSRGRLAAPAARYGLAWLDLSAGRRLQPSWNSAASRRSKAEIERLTPRGNPWLPMGGPARAGRRVWRGPAAPAVRKRPWRFARAPLAFSITESSSRRPFGRAISNARFGPALGCADKAASPSAAAGRGLLAYVRETQKSGIAALAGPSPPKKRDARASSWDPANATQSGTRRKPRPADRNSRSPACSIQTRHRHGRSGCCAPVAASAAARSRCAPAAISRG